MPNVKSVTVRFPVDVYEAAAIAAKDGEDSFNRFVTESVKARLKELGDKVLYDSFTMLGEDLAESSVEFAMDAQREVALSGD